MSTLIQIQSFSEYPEKVYNWFYNTQQPDYKDAGTSDPHGDHLYPLPEIVDRFYVRDWMEANIHPDTVYIRFKRK